MVRPPTRTTVIGLFLVVLLVVMNGGSGVPTIAADHGQIHLEGVSDQGVYPLSGSWELYEGLRPVTDPLPEPPEAYLSLPSTWAKATVSGKPLPTLGCVTLRLTLLHPWEGRQVALKLKRLNLAFELYADSVLIAEEGKVAQTPGAFRAKVRPQLVYFTPVSGRTVLTLRMANWNPTVPGGPVDEILFGERTSIEREAMGLFLTDAFVQGGMVLLVVVFLCFSLLWKSRPALLFALYNLATAIRLSTMREALLLQVFPDLDFNVFLRLFSSSTALAGPLLLLTLVVAITEQRTRRGLAPFGTLDRVILGVVLSADALLAVVLTVFGTGILWARPLVFVLLFVFQSLTYFYPLRILGAQVRDEGKGRGLFWVYALFAVNAFFVLLTSLLLATRDYLFPLIFLRDIRLPLTVVSYFFVTILGFALARQVGSPFLVGLGPSPNPVPQPALDSVQPPANPPPLPSLGLRVADLGLSRREAEVLELAVEGLSYDEIAARHFISRNTVKTHMTSIYRKSGVKNKTELAARLRFES